MTCPYCQHANPVDARFCTGCGQPRCRKTEITVSPATLTNAARLCEAAGHTDAAWLAYMLQWSYLRKGDYAQVLALQERALRMPEQRLHLRNNAWAQTAVSCTYAFLGRWDDAIGEGQTALRLGEEYTDSSMISFAVLYLLGVRVAPLKAQNMSNTAAPLGLLALPHPPVLLMLDKGSSLTCRSRQRYKDAILSPGCRRLQGCAIADTGAKRTFAFSLRSAHGDFWERFTVHLHLCALMPTLRLAGVNLPPAGEAGGGRLRRR